MVCKFHPCEMKLAFLGLSEQIKEFGCAGKLSLGGCRGDDMEILRFYTCKECMINFCEGCLNMPHKDSQVKCKYHEHHLDLTFGKSDSWKCDANKPKCETEWYE